MDKVSAISDINLNIGGQIFNLKNLYGKTLYGTNAVKGYASYLPGSRVKVTIPKGKPVGLIQGFVGAGYKGAVQSFFIIGQNTKDPNTFFVPYSKEAFSATPLKDQGVKNESEISAEEDKSAEPWYIKSIKTIAPWAVGAYLVSKFIK